MGFQHQLSITGATGVGTTSLVKALKKRLPGPYPYRWISAGQFMRERADQLGMTIDQLAKHNRDHPEEGHDRWCDNRVAAFAQTDWLVCESRLSHFFLPKAFKVLLLCSLDLRAQRRQRDFPHRSLDDVREEIRVRDDNDNARYVQIYGEDCLWGREKFDLVLHTSSYTTDWLADELLDVYELKCHT